MNILGIIVEYNPFHNGHLYHLNKAKEVSQCSHTVAVMSGHFLQRGEPALMDKWTRARIAVQNGVDLVIENPFVYSCQSADVFAYGSIHILNQLNIINTVAFGCENNNLEDLLKIEKVIKNEPKKFRNDLKKYLSKGESYPKARELALRSSLPGMEKYIATPNNILAIAYLKWLDTFNSPIHPIALKRKNTGYHDMKTVDDFASATYIRNEILQEKKIHTIKSFVPQPTWNNMLEFEKTQDFNHLQNYFSFIKSNLLRTTQKDLIKYFDVNEGLENRILKELANSISMEDYLNRLNTKRYTTTRIKRILLNHLLNHTKEQVYKIYKNQDFIPYARILAFNNKGKDIIYNMKETSNCTIVTNLSKSYHQLNPLQKYCMDKDILSTDYYNLPINISSFHKDFYKKPEII